MNATITLDFITLPSTAWRYVARPPTFRQVATALVAIAGRAILFGQFG